MINYLLILLRRALWGVHEELVLSEEQFQELMDLAKVQTVSGLAFDGLKQMADAGEIRVPKKVLLKWFAVQEKIKRNNLKVNQQLENFACLCNDHQIEYVVVKGQTVGLCYPQPMSRMPGDIDFLIRDDYEIVRPQLEETFQIHLPETMLEKELSFKMNGVLFELHNRLMDFCTSRHLCYWENLIKQSWQNSYTVNIGETAVRTLPPTLNAIYIFSHLFHHFMREGVGLRQFCDWAVFLHCHAAEIDSSQMEEVLQQLDLLDVAKAFGAILIDEIGLPAGAFPLQVEQKDRKWKGKMLRDILKSGNFGKLHHNAKTAWRYKLETFQLALSNSIRYYSLSPSEIGGMIPMMIRINLKLLK